MMTTPVDIDKLKEQIARIIDPEAFLTLREIAAEKGLDAANPPPGVVLLDPLDGPRNAMRPRCDIALTKAAEILAATALIAKAERVDALEADFRALEQAVSNSIRETDEPHRVLWKGQWYDGPAAEIANSILRAVQKLARNALSPKESE